jgi:choline dehydrogenase-like flavoprotein
VSEPKILVLGAGGTGGYFGGRLAESGADVTFLVREGRRKILSEQGLRIESPFRWITEPLDTDAAGQAAFHSCFDEIGREEGQRDGHTDLPNAAVLASAKIYDRGDPTRDYIIEPLTTAGDRADDCFGALSLHPKIPFPAGSSRRSQ